MLPVAYGGKREFDYDSERNWHVVSTSTGVACLASHMVAHVLSGRPAGEKRARHEKRMADLPFDR